MASTPKRLRHTALATLIALGAIGVSASAASAAYLTQACDRDGDDCVTLRCEDGGDDCRQVGGSSYQSDDDDDGQPGDGYHPYGYAPPQGDGETRYYTPTYDGYGAAEPDGAWQQHGLYDGGDDQDDGDDDDDGQGDAY